MTPAPDGNQNVGTSIMIFSPTMQCCHRVVDQARQDPAFITIAFPL